ncbi:OLC1v1019431C1 [Oldenlandia corymbosa var. corymbosa]|uniref:OLC1v1019431C1 n=1 Tax=Oldenlandia corymbosa var. corymbosa TaxID=529605 RepID=A0AAV1EE38_OLDCO|nr:OLC1v1019431C1 [Oldenlandia corymbosa var. corymbosa]
MSGTSGEKSFRTFPDELIIESLTWLPAKTLLRFRCVSKSWRSAILTPKFIKAHLRNSCKRDDYAHHRVIFRCGTSYGETKVLNDDIRYFPLAPALFGDVNTPIESTPVEDPVMNSSEGRIVGSSNGIVCVCVRNDVFFWNPAIGKFKKLPQFRTLSRKWELCRVMFEYNEVDDDYQVCIVDFGEKWIALYSGNTNSWREIQGFVTESGPCYFFVRGKLYWEKAGVFQGDLVVCCFHRTSHIDMWLWKEPGLRQFCTKVLLVPKLKDPSRKKFCVPIFMSKDGKILLSTGRSWLILTQ